MNEPSEPLGRTSSSGAGEGPDGGSRMMEERNHETTGQAMGASEPKAHARRRGTRGPVANGPDRDRRHGTRRSLRRRSWAAGASGSIASACAIAVVGPGWCRRSGVRTTGRSEWDERSGVSATIVSTICSARHRPKGLPQRRSTRWMPRRLQTVASPASLPAPASAAATPLDDHGRPRFRLARAESPRSAPPARTWRASAARGGCRARSPGTRLTPSSMAAVGLTSGSPTRGSRRSGTLDRTVPSVNPLQKPAGPGATANFYGTHNFL